MSFLKDGPLCCVRWKGWNWIIPVGPSERQTKKLKDLSLKCQHSARPIRRSGNRPLLHRATIIGRMWSKAKRLTEVFIHGGGPFWVTPFEEAILMDDLWTFVLLVAAKSSHQLYSSESCHSLLSRYGGLPGRRRCTLLINYSPNV